MKSAGVATGFCAVGIFLTIGCAQVPTAPKASPPELTARARATLINFTHDPSPLIRAHAIEALADTDQTLSINCILEGLNDTYWGVRFTAAMAILKLKHAPARPRLLKALEDPNNSVQAAAVGALHVLGDHHHTSRLGNLLFDKDKIVRRNAATVLGRMGDPGAVKLLKGTLRDEDYSLRLQALEAMTLLGYARASRLMITSCRSIYDDECILAMLTLARAQVPEARDPIGYIYEKNTSEDRLGMRLVAARALALFGDYRGRSAALAALRYHSNRLGKAANIRTLAALALAEMNDPATLGALEATLDDPDPDVRIAVATALLKIAPDTLPF